MLKEYFSYKWEPVLIDENNPYLFPEKRTRFMRKEYTKPAIYRWIIKKNSGNPIIYIGQTTKLFDRIYQYLNPGKKQTTNIRINKKLKYYKNKGYEIGIEYLRFCKIIKGDNFELFINENDLLNKYVRVFIENLMILIYKEKGYNLLNEPSLNNQD